MNPKSDISLRERRKVYRKTWVAKHPGKKEEMSRGSRLRIKEKAFLKIAAFHGDQIPRCRIDLTPNTPVSHLPCVGQLQIDHMNGRGWKEKQTVGDKLCSLVVRGKRSTDDLRILCQLHQLWNQVKT